MPRVCYCNKCKTEVPVEESCPHCGGKVAKTSEHLSFGYVESAYKDFFAYNEVLRVVICALVMVLVFGVIGEWIASGVTGVFDLLETDFVSILFVILMLCTLLLFLLLFCRGRQRVHCVINKEGVHVYTYVPTPSAWRLLAYFVSASQMKKLQEHPHQLPDLTMVRYDCILWNQMRFVHLWQGGHSLLVYRSRLWMATWAHFPLQEHSEIKEYLEKKLKRQKKCKYTVSM